MLASIRFAVTRPPRCVTPFARCRTSRNVRLRCRRAGEDSVGPVFGPVHAGLSEATHDRLATPLDHAGADLQALGAELGVAHARTVGGDVVHMALVAFSQWPTCAGRVA